MKKSPAIEKILEKNKGGGVLQRDLFALNIIARLMKFLEPLKPVPVLRVIRRAEYRN